MKTEPPVECRARRHRLLRLSAYAGLRLVLLSAVAAAQYVQSPPAADTFRSLMAAAMTRMDQGMSVADSGEPDRDFRPAILRRVK